MGWGEVSTLSVGTTAEIELAHKAFDDAGIPPGILSVRCVNAALAVVQLKLDLHLAVVQLKLDLHEICTAVKELRTIMAPDE